MGNTATTVLVEEGWIVADLATYRYLNNHPPPRPHAFLRAFLVDVREWRVLAFWTLCAAEVGLGIVIVLAGLPGFITSASGFISILGGTVAFLIWLWIFSVYALGFRNGPLRVGIVSSLSKHPMSRKLAIAQASMWNGYSMAVWLWRSPASELIERYGSIEVLFLQTKGSKYSSVWGVRQAPTSIRELA